MLSVTLHLICICRPVVGGIGPLVSVANAADLETQRCIAYALCNLASDPSRRIDIVREGGLSIISMACSEDQNDQSCDEYIERYLCYRGE